MKDYASMSDFEINSAVHNALLDKPCELTFHGNGKITRKDRERGGVWETGIVGYTKNGLHGYCNNPADSWPIITENRISTIYLGENEWGCRGDGDKSACRAINSNALRCAMVVFLKMKEDE